MVGRLAAAILSATILAVITSPAFALTGNCWGDLKAPLQKGGFTPTTKCDDLYELEVHYIGRTDGARKYRVYLVDWVLASVLGGPGHGGQKLLIFDDHLRYLGQYNMPDGVDRAWIEGSTVHFNLPADLGNVLRLNGPHPPWRAWFGGDTNGFGK